MARSYGSQSIQTLTPLAHIRKFPARHMGEHDTPTGLVQPIKEIVANSADEVICDPSTDYVVDVVLCKTKTSYQCIVCDHARGIPLDKLLKAFSVPGTSGKWASSYVATAGCHGEGAKATAALSNMFVGLTVRARQGAGMIALEKGVVTRDITKTNPGKLPVKHGTAVFFELDETLYTTVGSFFETSYSLVLDLFEFLAAYIDNLSIRLYQATAPITKTQLKGSISDVGNLLYTHGRDTTAVVFNIGSRLEYVKKRFSILDSPTWALDLTKKFDPAAEEIMEFEASLFTTSQLRMGICSSVNLVPIYDLYSFHIKLLFDAIRRKMASCIDNKSLREFFVSNYQIPFYGSISVRIRDPKFVDQTKEKFRDRGFMEPYVDLVERKLKHVAITKWEQLYELIEEDVVVRYNTYLRRMLGSQKGLKNIEGTLARPRSYRACATTDKTKAELIICEGESAGGVVVQARDPNFQAVFTLRGKFLNAVRAPDDKLINNDVVGDLLNVMGVGISHTDDDLSKLNFGKAIILTDADDDGYHIANLLLGLFKRVSHKLFDDRHIHLANPPLYGLTVGKKCGFLKDDIALMDTRISSIYQKVMNLYLLDLNSNTRYRLRKDDFRSYIYLVDRIGQTFSKLSRQFAIHIEHLECLACVVDYLTPETMDEKIIVETLNVDSASYDRGSNTLIVVTGGVDTIIPLRGLPEAIRAYLLPLLEEMRWTATVPVVEWKIKVNEDWTDHAHCVIPISRLWTYLQWFNDQFSVRRFKGLGEMRAAELSMTCLNPDTRVLTAISSIGDLDVIYGMLGQDPTMRKALISTI